MYQDELYDDELTPPSTVTEFVDLIEDRFAHPPQDRRRRREVDAWTQELNVLIRGCNELAGFKMYKPLK